MEYHLKEASENHIDKLIEYKHHSIFDYATNLSMDEVARIEEYIKNTICLEIKNYSIIEVDKNEIGCVLVTKKENKTLLDELYIEEEYRGKGIETCILKDITNKYSPIYLWVYKQNKGATTLYQKLGFKVVEEVEERYFMEYKNEEMI